MSTAPDLKMQDAMIYRSPSRAAEKTALPRLQLQTTDDKGNLSAHLLRSIPPSRPCSAAQEPLDLVPTQFAS